MEDEKATGRFGAQLWFLGIIYSPCSLTKEPPGLPTIIGSTHIVSRCPRTIEAESDTATGQRIPCRGQVVRLLEHRVRFKRLKSQKKHTFITLVGRRLHPHYGYGDGTCSFESLKLKCNINIIVVTIC